MNTKIIYFISFYDSELAKKLSELIDEYIRRAFDYEIIMRELSFQETKSAVYENIQDAMEKIIATRQELTVLGARTLSAFQWVVLFSLALLVIRDLDLYIWNEKTFGYDIFENVLRAVGKLPYYPEESIKKGRIRPAEKEYRVGICLDYPSCLTRRIETRTN